MPAYVGGEIEPDALLHELETFVSAPEMGENEALHA